MIDIKELIILLKEIKSNIEFEYEKCFNDYICSSKNNCKSDIIKLDLLNRIDIALRNLGE